MRRLGVALMCLALGAAGAGCGGDDEPTDTTEPPLPSLPQGSPAPDTGTDTNGDSTDGATDTTPSTDTAPTEPSGGAPAPAPDAPADSPTNDVAPEPGSPESRFEDACEQNPAACG